MFKKKLVCNGKDNRFFSSIFKVFSQVIYSFNKQGSACGEGETAENNKQNIKHIFSCYEMSQYFIVSWLTRRPS